jgi:glycine dehydrogenase
MLGELGFDSLDALAHAIVPKGLQLERPLLLPGPRSESEVLNELRVIAGMNRKFRSYIGMGYYDCVTPQVIQRNVLENPGWYTPYTPYQAEVSQGRLEMMLNFQTMICELTALEIANASLLDEATAAAEAMTMCRRLKAAERRNVFFVSDQCHPQSIEVVRTRARALDIELLVGDHDCFVPDARVFGALVQYPATRGQIYDYQEFTARLHASGALVVVAADPLSLTLLKPPGELGADVAVGSTQRFGVPLGYGGPHAAYFATRDAFKRQMPGRLVGVSRDAHGGQALRLALQTREQHIRREKATSNICTAQVLPANLAAMYAIYHGPEGLRQIARRIHLLACLLAAGLRRLGYEVDLAPFFDTLQVHLARASSNVIMRIAEEHQINLRALNEHDIGISLDETTTPAEVSELWQVFNSNAPVKFSPEELVSQITDQLPAGLLRKSRFLTQPVFNRYHSETEMLRYLRRLESRDLSLTTSMIPLGSCTMKLSAACGMSAMTWPEFNRVHPFAPSSQAEGYQRLFRQLERWLAEITGLPGVSFQPNAGSQGEYAGLLVIRRHHECRGQAHRNVCLIPTSAHGTNPASAVMAGLTVVTVLCDTQGNIDVADLAAKAQAHRNDLAALMVTYPSTHGVFEERIQEICRIIHEFGGQVYMDGANLNAQLGLCRPVDLGADVCHLNLHKTFGMPHGGGGPGMGPIAVAKHLVEFLPSHPVIDLGAGHSIGPVSAAPWGSASLLPISWAYLAAMGASGLKEATQVAILNANYVAKRLAPYFPVLYCGSGGFVAHECILDLRQFHHVSAEDVAKRLMDYGFHAPTLSWPVPGTLMVEPTESESKAELDRFCEAMIAIHAEIQAIESGQGDRLDNPLKNAPHTAQVVSADQWDRPYSRGQAAYPLPWLRDHKFWPAVGRIDNVHGDRYPICTWASG